MSKGGGKPATYPGISACNYESRFRGCSLKTVRSGLQTRQGRSIDPRGGAGSSVTDDNVTVGTPDMGGDKVPNLAFNELERSTHCHYSISNLHSTVYYKSQNDCMGALNA
jgi:hypothetical protein